MTPTSRRVAVDGAFVARPRPSVIEVEIDGERVLYDTVTTWTWKLDPVGSLMWTLLDGTSSLDEIAEDLAAGFAVEVESARAGLFALVGDLIGHEFLESAHGS